VMVGYVRGLFGRDRRSRDCAPRKAQHKDQEDHKVYRVGVICIPGWEPGMKGVWVKSPSFKKT
jgi:hypothetical protein